MSYRQQSPNRRSRRDNLNAPATTEISAFDLPGPLKLLGNRKLFFALAFVAGFAMVASLAFGILGVGGSSNPANQPMQANQAPDVAIDTPSADSSATPGATAEPVVKHYDAPPPMVIDPAQTYTATISTSKGDIKVELYPKDAPQSVNAFVFLAQDGYYNGTQFMQLITNQDGSKFYAEAGDPTATGLGTPGFSIPKEVTEEPFARGSIGMGGSASDSNGGQFFISYGDYPALNGKYTIFGKVVSGLDVLDNLSLLDLTSDAATTSQGDTIESISISPAPLPTPAPTVAATPPPSGTVAPSSTAVPSGTTGP
jgi:cyclophilin family peptidyl-prolyl cis-trans isomerase